MKRIIYYILLFISIFCLQVSYVVAGSNNKLTSESIRLLAVGTTARGLVVMLDLSSGSGSNFIININGRDVEVNHRALAQYIKDDPDLDADKILLLSCSNFTAAQNLANKIGKRVIATDGIVRIYSDGGILSFNNGVKDKFEECVPDASRIPVTQPRAPSSETLAYVSMGAGDEFTDYFGTYPGILRFISSAQFTALEKGTFKTEFNKLTAAQKTRLEFLSSKYKLGEADLELGRLYISLSSGGSAVLAQFANATAWTDDNVTYLRSKLVRVEDYEALFDDLKNPCLLDLALRIIENPINALEEYKSNSTLCQTPILNRLATSTFFLEALQNGRDFETYIKGQLAYTDSKVYQDLLFEVPDLADRTILYQVYFCINNSSNCNDAGTYFIADFVLVKKNTDMTYDIIIVDTKLSANTNLTQNQSNAQALPTAFKLKSFNGSPIIGNINNLTTNSQFQKLTKPFIIIYSNGSGGFGDIK